MDKSDDTKKKLCRQQYVLVGRHSASKVCEYTKKSMRDEDFCYKQQFYGINSHLCVQMSPFLACSNSCIFCWRDVDSRDYLKKDAEGIDLDTPDEIIDGCIKAQIKQLRGFGGNKRANRRKYLEAKSPKHFAISLTGEPTLYPKLKVLIERLGERGMSSFVVTNGMFPDALKDINPTQLYVSVPAPNKELYQKIDRPLFKDAWSRFLKTMDVLKEKRDKDDSCRTALRVTLIKDMNDVHPEQYAELIERANPMFVEVKSYMWVGFSQKRLLEKNMMYFDELKKFASEIGKHCGYKLIDEKERSRVVLLMKEDRKDRKL